MINWSLYPLLRPTMMFVLGIVIGIQLPNIQSWVLSGLGVLVFILTGLAFVERYRAYLLLRSICIWLIFVLLGVVSTQVVHRDWDSYHYSNHISSDKQDVVIILEEDVRKRGSSRAFAQVVNIDDHSCRGKIVVYFDRHDPTRYVHGNMLLVTGKISPIRSNTNPAAFDYKAYLDRLHISHQLRVDAGAHTMVVPDALPYHLSTARRVRAWALSSLDRLITNANHRAVAAAMILGYKHDLTDDLYTAYSETGAIHVLAVSGLHVGIITMVFLFLFRRIHSQKWWVKGLKVVVLLSIVWSYCMITGAAPAVVRASVMFSFLVVGRQFFESANIYNILMASAMVILSYDPYLLFQVGFQLSYLALTSIVFFANRFSAPFTTKWRVINYVVGLIAVSIAAQILVFPITTYYFHKFPLYFILSGIVAVPAAGAILIVGLMTLVLQGIPYISDVLATLLNIILGCFEYTIDAIHKLPYASISGLWYEPYEVILLYASILLGMAAMYSHQAYKYIYATLVIGIVGIGYSTYKDYSGAHSSSLVVYDIGRRGSLIDVKDGKSIYTMQSDNLRSRDVAYNAGNYRLKHGVNRADTLLLERGYFQLKEHTIHVVGKTYQNNTLGHPKYIILTGRSRLSPRQYSDTSQLSYVITDATIPAWLDQEWSAYCQDRDIRYHSVRASGAFVQKF